MCQQDVYDRCLYLARRYLPGDPALEPADLVQAAYLKVARTLDTARPAYEQVAYLRRAIVQVAIDASRRFARFPREALPQDLPLPGDVAREATSRADLDAALDTPGVGLSEAVLFGLGYTYPEIAARRGLPETTIKNRIHRGRVTRREGGGGAA